MTPKEKAKDIYFSFLNQGKGLISDFLAKGNTVICAQNCKEIAEWYRDNFACLKESAQKRVDYWQRVLTEIKSL